MELEMKKRKTALLVMGSIGSGKSEFCKYILQKAKEPLPYISSDAYKTRDFPTKSKLGFLMADEEAFLDMEKLCKEGKSFIYERCPTNLKKLKHLKKLLKKYSYNAVIFFIGTNKSTINIRRVHAREMKEGFDYSNHVEDVKIDLRYRDTFNNILELFHLANKIYFWDNSSETLGNFDLVAIKEGTRISVYQQSEWFNKFVKEKIEQNIAIEKSLLKELYTQKRFLLQAMFI
jgi:predicted ABC-type ATPase